MKCAVVILTLLPFTIIGASERVIIMAHLINTSTQKNIVSTVLQYRVNDNGDYTLDPIATRHHMEDQSERYQILFTLLKVTPYTARVNVERSVTKKEGDETTMIQEPTPLLITADAPNPYVELFNDAHLSLTIRAMLTKSQ